MKKIGTLHNNFFEKMANFTLKIWLRFRVNIDLGNCCVPFIGDSFGTACIKWSENFNLSFIITNEGTIKTRLCIWGICQLKDDLSLEKS
jgi:hypothetical protein